ncbi:hypothetical protein TNCV_4172161 [Trichonephila clavipes]|nr:hypothetical protein TNCV_4172161 [Trichonephila clavipes]
MPNNDTTWLFMAAVYFLHHENPPTWARVESVTLGADGRRQTNYATLSALAKLSGLSQTQAHEIHQDKGLDVRLSFAVALSTRAVTVRFRTVPTKLEGEDPRSGPGPPISLLLPPTS